VHSASSAKGSSDGDDLVAMLNRVSNKPGPSIAPTAAHTTVAGNDSEPHPGSTRPGVQLYTARPNGDRNRPGDSGLKSASMKSPFSESFPLTEETDLNTHTSMNPAFNESAWLKSNHGNGFHSQSQMPGVHIKLYESEFPPGINEVLDTMKGPLHPHVAETINRSQAVPSGVGDVPYRPTKHPNPPVVYEPSADDQGTVRANSEKTRSGSRKSGKPSYHSRSTSMT